MHAASNIFQLMNKTNWNFRSPMFPMPANPNMMQQFPQASASYPMDFRNQMNRGKDEQI